MKKVVGIYFSGTGSTKKVLECFLSSWEHEYQLVSIPYDQCKNFNQEDVCIVAVPSYGGRVPSVASEFLEQLYGNKTPVILIVTYGNRNYDDTFIELKDIMSNQGFTVVGAMAVICEHSIMHQFAQGRPDSKDLKQIAADAVILKEHLNFFKEVELPGNRPYRDYNGVPLKPTAADVCNKCGLCVKSCPTGAILNNNPKQIDKSKCISCMKCVTICPKQARKVSKLLLKIASITLKKECQKRKENEIFI